VFDSSDRPIYNGLIRILSYHEAEAAGHDRGLKYGRRELV
jgi:hypothetical protein